MSEILIQSVYKTANMKFVYALNHFSEQNDPLINSGNDSQSIPNFFFKRQRLTRKDLGRICSNLAISIFFIPTRIKSRI